MRKNGTPKRVRGERAKEISKALTQLLRHAAPRLGIRIQEDGYVDMGDLLRAPRFWNQWITEAEVIDVIHHNQKNRFEVSFQRGHYQVRALQGHSISHVRDDLVLTQLSIEDTPEYAAHGTYYDFYESILRHGLMAGGQQGPSFRRHVHQLPWEGAISGMRSDCDLVIWICTREAAASGVRFFRSANEVLLTETTIDSLTRLSSKASPEFRGVDRRWRSTPPAAGRVGDFSRSDAGHTAQRTIHGVICTGTHYCEASYSCL